MTELRSISQDSGFFSVDAQTVRDATLPSASTSRFRTIGTALVALVLGIALVSWLKAGGDETRPAVGSHVARPTSPGR